MHEAPHDIYISEPLCSFKSTSVALKILKWSQTLSINNYDVFNGWTDIGGVMVLWYEYYIQELPTGKLAKKNNICCQKSGNTIPKSDKQHCLSHSLYETARQLLRTTPDYDRLIDW